MGYTLTAESIKPQAKKSSDPTNCDLAQQKRASTILGVIDYYRDMVANKTALCQPLHRLASANNLFTWLSRDTDAFRAVQREFAEAVLISLSDFDKPFYLCADASGTKLCGDVMQEMKIISCYSRALTKHQINYTKMELKLLSISESLREYRTMLLGFPVLVHTDHKKLIYPTETNMRVKR